MVSEILTPPLLNGVFAFTLVPDRDAEWGRKCLVKFYTLTRTQDHPRYSRYRLRKADSSLLLVDRYRE